MKRSVRMVSLAEDYLASRRRLGFDLRCTGRRLLDFACFADRSGHQGPLTVKLAASWARSGPGQAPLPGRAALRSFARSQGISNNLTAPPKFLLFIFSAERITV
jgi:hypothetical protein